MSKCELSFELDRQPATYRPGQEVRGRVLVRVDATCRCEALEISLGWRTHGKGNRDQGTPRTERLGPFDWGAGEQHQHDFTFKLPNGPVSYHGQYVNVDWYLKASADIPWAIDPNVETELLLEPAPVEKTAAPSYRGAPQAVTAPLVQAPQASNAGITPAGMLVVMILVLGFFAYALWPFVDSQGRVLWLRVGILTFGALIAGRIAWPLLRNAAAKRKLGDVRLELLPAATTRGETVTVKVTIRPQRRATIRGVNIELLGEEVAVSGSRSHRQTHRACLHRVVLPVGVGERALLAGEDASFEGCVELPPDAAPTFHSTDNKVQWTATAHVDIPAWPDLREERELIVWPS